MAMHPATKAAFIWGTYIISTLLAFIIMVTRAIGSRNSDLALIANTTLYFMWLIFLVFFVWLCSLKITTASRLIITCIYHLICIGAVLAFLDALGPNNNDTLVLIPLAIQLGISIAVGLKECASKLSWRHVRVLLLSLLNGLRLVLGDEEARLPL